MTPPLRPCVDGSNSSSCHVRAWLLCGFGQAPTPRRAGAAFDDAVVLTLPTVPTRSLEAYKIDGGESS